MSVLINEDAARAAYAKWFAVKQNHDNAEQYTYEYFLEYLKHILAPSSTIIHRPWTYEILGFYVKEASRSSHYPFYLGPSILRRIINTLVLIEVGVGIGWLIFG